MVDVDGVLLVHPDKRGWGADLEKELGLPLSLLQTAFFEKHWDDVVHGRASLRDRLAPVLEHIAPQITCDALIDFWFINDAHINEALLTELASIRANGIEVHLATVQEHERAAYVWDVLGFRRWFDGMHYAADLGCSKPALSFYRSIEARTGYEAQDLFLIDDRIENVKGAIASGWTAALWTGDETLRSLLPEK